MGQVDLEVDRAVRIHKTIEGKPVAFAATYTLDQRPPWEVSIRTVDRFLDYKGETLEQAIGLMVTDTSLRLTAAIESKTKEAEKLQALAR